MLLTEFHIKGIGLSVVPQATEDPTLGYPGQCAIEAGGIKFPDIFTKCRDPPHQMLLLEARLIIKETPAPLFPLPGLGLLLVEETYEV